MIIPRIPISCLFFAISFYCMANPAPLTHDELRDSMLYSLKQNERGTAQLLLEKGLEKAKKEDNLLHYFELIKKAGTYWRKSSSPEICIEIYKKGFQQSLWRLPNNEDEWKSLAWLYAQIAKAYDVSFGDYGAAKIVYEKASSIFGSKITDVDFYYVARFVWKPLGNVYTRIGDFLISETLLDKFIQQMLLNNDHKRAAKGYNDLALLYEEWGKTLEAQEAYKNGLSLENEEEVSKSTLLVNLGSFALKQDSFAMSFNYIFQAQEILQKAKSEGDYSSRVIYLLGVVQNKLAATYQATQDYEQAKTALEKSINYYQEYYGHTKRREFAKVYKQLGGLFYDMADYKGSINYYQTSLENVLYDYQPNNELDLPSANNFYPENTICEALEGMAQTYQTWYETNKNIELLEKGLECYHLINVVEAHLRRSCIYENSKLLNLEESQQRSDKAINLAYQLYEITNNTDYLYQAFSFAERNRSSLLREALRSSKAINELELSAEELEQEKDLAYLVSKAQDAWFSLQGEETPDSLIQAANQLLLNAKDAQQKWIQALEAEHPRYYQLKYNDALPSLETYQAMLQNGQLMLEYFIGKEHLYVFAIDKKGIELHQLDLPEKLTQKVLSWRKSIVDYQYPTIDKTQLMIDYRQLGYELYEELLQDVLAAHKGYDHLLIVSSGILDLLPFEALLHEKVAATATLKQYPYLLNEFTVAYAYSATLYHSLLQLERKGEGLGAFAPSFADSEAWPTLSCGANLFKKLKTPWKKSAWLNKEATTQRFREMAGKYQVLHLATHAQANAEFGDFSFILLHNEQGGYDSLFAKDLYLLDIDAELVILSACETALGTLYDSEGVISLARAFHYAGARSVLTTLWRINEGANCQLMEYFYEELGGNPTKPLALQKAKQRYIENADSRDAHPVYWAGFQFSGNPRSVDEPSDFGWYVLGGSLLVFFGFFFKKKGEKKVEVNTGQLAVLS